MSQIGKKLEIGYHLLTPSLIFPREEVSQVLSFLVHLKLKQIVRVNDPMQAPIQEDQVLNVPAGLSLLMHQLFLAQGLSLRNHY